MIGGRQLLRRASLFEVPQVVESFLIPPLKLIEESQRSRASRPRGYQQVFKSWVFLLAPGVAIVILVLIRLVAAHLRLLSRRHGLSMLLLPLRQVVEPGVLQRRCC